MKLHTNLFRPTRRSYAALALAVLVAAPFVVAGCGGGGGDGDFGISGTLMGPAQTRAAVAGGFVPIDNATVTVMGTGDTGYTDGDGNFSLHTDAPGSTVTLIVAGVNLSGNVTLDGIPSNATDAVVALEGDESGVRATSVEYVTGEEGSNVPRPTVAPGGPTVEPQPSAEPQPTTAPGSPTVAPQPTTGAPGSPTSKPTAKPTTPPSGGGGSAAVARGKKVFAAQCQSCHTPASMAGRTAKQIAASGMSSYYTNAQLPDLVAYLASL